MTAESVATCANWVKKTRPDFWQPILPLVNRNIWKRSENTQELGIWSMAPVLFSILSEMSRCFLLHRNIYAAQIGFGLKKSLSPKYLFAFYVTKKLKTIFTMRLACVQQLQGASALPVSNQSANKRPFPESPNAPSPSHLPPSAQRIHSDFQIGEGEVESPQRELLRSQLDPETTQGGRKPVPASCSLLQHLASCGRRHR